MSFAYEHKNGNEVLLLVVLTVGEYFIAISTSIGKGYSFTFHLRKSKGFLNLYLC